MLTKLMLMSAMWWMTACSHVSPIAAQTSLRDPPPTTAPEQAPATQPATQPGGSEIVTPQDVPPAVPQPQIPAEVNDLLDRLEQSAADLKSFTADVKYDKEDAILGRKELRTGSIIYRVDPETKEKSFAILLDSTIINGIKRTEPKYYVFNGRWLAEVDPKNKQFIKREIVPPGRKLDPLKLGEGPFPLPIGQPKAEVLSRFAVTIALPPTEPLLQGMEDVQSMSLTPRPNVPEAKDFKKVDLYYDRKTLLPVGIKMEEVNGDIKLVRLTNIQRNPELTPEQLSKLNIQEPDPREWRIDVRPWSQGDER